MSRFVMFILLLTIGVACRETFDAPNTGPASGFLVVEGVINSGAGSTTVRLSRSVTLADSGQVSHERFAQVRVEGEDNSSAQLYETGLGVYSVDQLALNRNVKYRIHIYTVDGKEYVSDFSAVKATPPIDTLSWERTSDGGVELSINTHDPQNNTKYYKWDYEETWEFHSNYLAQLKYVRNPGGFITGVGFSTAEEMQKMFTCWTSESSSTILIGSSAKLSRDTIHLAIVKVPPSSWKISVLYSILVKQHAISERGFDFLQRMKKNTESLGSLFDAQPSQLNSNIRCVTNPDEAVIGFVEVADVQEKRMFISKSEVPGWDYSFDCSETSLPNNPDSLNLIQESLIPTSIHITGTIGEIIRFWSSEPICVDCNKRGTNVKPAFWP